MGSRVTILIAMDSPFAEPIRSVQELQELGSSENGVACFIFLNGNFRSSKHIWFKRNRFRVLSEIDGTVESAHIRDFASLGSGLILEAIERGCFYRYLSQ
jgi:hypothetical protein